MRLSIYTLAGKSPHFSDFLAVKTSSMASPNDPTQAFRVLLVEEDEMTCDLIGKALVGAKMDCASTCHIKDGLQLFKSHRPHLVLLSLGLPEIGGAVLCQPIRAQSSVPIAILSVRTRREDHIHALNLGADEFIQIRPLDDQLMMVRLLALLRRTYRYDKRAARERLDTEVTAVPQAQLPIGWATCEACSYMGPQRRFERLNSLGEAALLCPHCNQAQSPRFSVS